MKLWNKLCEIGRKIYFYCTRVILSIITVVLSVANQ